MTENFLYILLVAICGAIVIGIVIALGSMATRKSKENKETKDSTAEPIIEKEQPQISPHPLVKLVSKTGKGPYVALFRNIQNPLFVYFCIVEDITPSEDEELIAFRYATDKDIQRYGDEIHVGIPY